MITNKIKKEIEEQNKKRLYQTITYKNLLSLVMKAIELNKLEVKSKDIEKLW